MGTEQIIGANAGAQEFTLKSDARQHKKEMKNG